ncbi:hypothetical protein QJS04_geneDACA002971 [Acorus gramineus]|uniref:Uncharacterized protein n=1 Tax=Acorus gramineus TaxID=55184 RepID=A0AAV9BSK7_ACOGR|nr:hypothetical protein QJS04_geneDACA002971 [Acorus gramineus]
MITMSHSTNLLNKSPTPSPPPPPRLAPHGPQNQPAVPSYPHIPLTRITSPS